MDRGGRKKVVKKAALTFDGAPNAPGTKNILDVLEKRCVFGTFFMEGHRIEKDAETAVVVKEKGHDIGNHSYSHPMFDEVPLEEVKEEVERTDMLLREKVGVETKLLRPPAGQLTPEVKEFLEELGFQIVLWNCTGLRDWEGPTAKDVANRVMKLAGKDPLILVFHDRVPWVPETLNIIIPELYKEGYDLVKISELGISGIIE